MCGARAVIWNWNIQIQHAHVNHLKPSISTTTKLPVNKTVIKLTFGLYSAFLAWRAIFFKSSLQPRFTVDTIFLFRQNEQQQIISKRFGCFCIKKCIPETTTTCTRIICFNSCFSTKWTFNWSPYAAVQIKQFSIECWKWSRIALDLLYYSLRLI